MTIRIKKQDMAAELFVKSRNDISNTASYVSQNPMHLFCRLNDYAFLLNLSERFEEAEKVLRAVGRVGLPSEYRCLYKILWKNLGVSLEHQGQYEEAAECYLKAVCRSGKRYGAVKYLERLIGRHPSLKKIPEVSAWLRTYRKQDFNQYSLDFNLPE